MENYSEIRKLRKKAELNQDVVSGWIGKHRGNYSKKEGGKLTFTIDEIALIMRK